MNTLNCSTTFAMLIFAQTGWADPLDTWTLRNPEPTANDLHGIVYANGQFVATGAGGAILTSADGVDWRLRQSPTMSALSGIAYGNGQFVAVGDGGTILTSSDGVKWIQRASGKEIPLLAVTYGNNQFVAVGGGYDEATSQWGGTIVTSADGLNWVPRLSATTNEFLGIAYANGLFVAVGQLSAYTPLHSTLLTSADGANWVRQQVTIPDDGLGSVAYGNGQFVAVSRPNGMNSFVLTSADGVNWTVHYPRVANLSGLTYGNGQFVGIVFGGDVATSPDGVNWVERPSGLPWNDRYAASLEGITYGGGQFVAVGDLGTVMASIDGVSWVLRQPRELIALSDISYGNSQFVAVGNSYNPATSLWQAITETSGDGIAWAQNHVAPGASFTHVAYGDGQFVATGYWSNMLSGLEGDIFTSTNGINWIPRRSGTTNALGLIDVHGPLLITTSPDGMNWSGRFLPGVQIRPRAIAYGNGHFVAVGPGGTILQSGSIVRLGITPKPGTGLVELSLEGPIGLDYMIQSSTDLISWRDVTKFISAQSSKTILEGVSAASDHLFYRAFSQ